MEVSRKTEEIMNSVNAVSDSRFWVLMGFAVLLFLILVGGVIAIAVIVQHEKTKRTQMIIRISSSKKLLELAEKQLENEITGDNAADEMRWINFSKI